MTNFCDCKMQSNWSYICMQQLSDFVAEIIHILPFLLFFFLISLIILRGCISVGFLLHLILNSRRQGRIPLDETIDC